MNLRHVFSVLFLSCALLISAPAISYAAMPYFTGDGQEAALEGTLNLEFAVGSTGGVDITLVNRGPATWVLASGRFPAGITLTPITGDSTRSVMMIGGTPTEEGSFPVRIIAIAGTSSYFVNLVINTYAPTLSISPLWVAEGRVGLPYSQPLTAGGSLSIHSGLYWGISSGELPPGLSLNTATGVISGTPTTAGTYRYLVRMNETGGRLRSATPREYVHVIQAATVSPVRFTTRANPVNGRVGTTYPAQIFSTTGGSGSYRWAITAGALPPGISLNTATGILSGTPTLAGTYEANVKVYDNASDLNSDSLTFTLVVSPPVVFVPPTITPVTTPVAPTPVVSPTPAPGTGGLLVTTSFVPNGTVGTDYTTTLSATGGTAPYSWNFASGALPPGLSLSAAGVVSGRPTAAGVSAAYIEVFDATGAFVGRPVTFTVVAASVGSPTPVTPTPTTPSTPSPSASAELTARLNTLARIGVSAHALVKLPDDGNRFTQADSAVYYVGGDGRRHAFPNDRVFFSWYSNFDGVRVVSAADLASIPLGLNATYKPGTKMVKFTTDPKVYAIGANRSLRWIKTEGAAVALYGSSWNRQIDDLSDSLYMDYTFGADINTASDYDRVSLQSTIRTVSDTFPL